MQHSFHIPVLGLGYSVDTPLKVARYGISSVVSIVDDELVERMRKYHSELHKENYQYIGKEEDDSRAHRITAYLDLLNKLVTEQINAIRLQRFEEHNDLHLYFDLLPETSALKKSYQQMLLLDEGRDKQVLQQQLKDQVTPGRIDVNIMSKVDKINYLKGQPLGDSDTDALAALRGFANSTLHSSLVISAGLNPRLFSYMTTFPGFYPDAIGLRFKNIILKVSDYRSAMIQAKILAKKGLWVSEFRIESGLNCGGHAFATEGLLLGPILQEFKDNHVNLYADLFQLYVQGLNVINPESGSPHLPQQRITVQGGLGTAEEHDFLLAQYKVDAIGWGSPFLLVPEATNVDEQTLQDLANGTEDDFYLSNASPLGIPFNNFRKSTAEVLRLERIAQGKPGNPCTKKFLVSNTEFTKEPICTASRKYQNLKIKQLKSLNPDERELEKQISLITEKLCLCEGLCASVYLKDDLLKPRENKAVSICPGPNLAYFSRKYTLREMVDHIYGRCDLLKGVNRPNLFIKELGLYIDYLKKEFENLQEDVKKMKSLSRFYDQLQNGVNYYRELISKTDPALSLWNEEQLRMFNSAVNRLMENAVHHPC
jgi:hypothetical protein